MAAGYAKLAGGQTISYTPQLDEAVIRRIGPSDNCGACPAAIGQKGAKRHFDQRSANMRSWPTANLGEAKRNRIFAG